MDCPHCGNQTDPTLLYCKSCGEAVELDPDEVAKQIERDDEAVAIEHLEEKTAVGLYVAAFALVVIFAFRLVVVRPVVADVAPGYYAPARIVEDKGLDPPSTIDLPPLPIEIPTENRSDRPGDLNKPGAEKK